jgi:hypothetical protein
MSAKASFAKPLPDNNGCRMHETYNMTCGTCNGFFDKDGNPTAPHNDTELDGILIHLIDMVTEGDGEPLTPSEVVHKAFAKKRLTQYIHKQVTEAEAWLDVVDWGGLYQVSTAGRVRSLPRKTTKGGILRQSTSKRGYKTISLNNGSYKTNASVHKLVATAFIPNPNNKPCINHIDGNPSNNRVGNLEWCTYSENELHAYSLGKVNPNHPHRFIGTDKKPAHRPTGIKETKPRRKALRKGDL